MFFINPFIYAAGADFESIATVTVGSGGASSIEFTSIPGTYQHLQLRMIGRSTRSSTDDYCWVQFNSDTGSNYAYHLLVGNGADATASGYASQTGIDAERLSGSTATANAFGAIVMDLLDYSSTTKNKTLRCFGGYNNNTTTTINVGHTSGLWMNTSAITSVTLTAQAGSSNFAQYTTAALYGIKAP